MNMSQQTEAPYARSTSQQTEASYAKSTTVQESTDGSICTRVNDRRKVIIHKSKGQRQTEGDYTQVKGQ